MAQIWADEAGQDLIEYALLGGFISICAAALVPTALNPIGLIGSKVHAVLTRCLDFF
jgi:Flp pilus assembly pilin Flp